MNASAGIIRRTRWRLALRAGLLVIAVLAMLSGGVWFTARQLLFGRLYERLEQAAIGSKGSVPTTQPEYILIPAVPGHGATVNSVALDPDRDHDSDFQIITSAQYGVLAVLSDGNGDGGDVLWATSAAGDVSALRIFALLLAGLTLVGGLLSVPVGYLLAGRALRPVEQAIEERSAFVALASHRLRTPLSVIRTSAELALARQAVGPEEALRTIVGQSEEMESLANRLTNLARSESGLPMRRSAVDLRSIAARVCTLLAPAALAGDVQLRLDAPGVVWAAGMETDITDALSSVVENAIHFSPRGGSVTVRVGDGHTWRRLEVVDAGPGIAAEDLPRVTEPFYQGKANGRGGTGLGLAIASAAMARLRGRLEIVSTPNGGTTVRLLLRSARPHRHRVRGV